MTSTSPSDGNDSQYATPVTPPVPADLIPRAPIRRARPQLSCTPCRQGKLKCNREHPVCDQCAKRSRQDVCKYPPPPTKTKQAQNMRGRIRNLENLVVSLINQKGHEPGNPTTASPSTQVAPQDGNDELGAERFGKLHISHNGNETKYVGAGHWSNILKEIEQVRDNLEDEDEEETLEEEQSIYANASSSITFGMPKPMTKAQLILALPPKEEIDRLLPLWFHSFDPLLFIIHAPTFQKNYNNFWADPSSASIMWIALLYSAMALSIITGPRNPGMNASYKALFGDADHLSQSADRFLQLASSAFALGDIVKNQPYTLEALMVYTECEFLRRDDGHSKVWLMHGMAIRMALRMGYHRDPKNFPEISPFDGEMRRRVWQVLTITDNLISFAIGLPTLVRSVVSDTRPPSNYMDSDIDPSMTELPPPRPNTDVTTALYHLSKRGVVDVFAQAAELNHQLTPPKHSTIMELDKKLNEAYSRYPEALRVRPVEESVGHMPTLIMCRFNMELTYQKSRIVLHRNFLKAGQTDTRYADSRDICVEAALKTLNYHKDIFHACQPGGQMSKIWWYTSALQTYDFLLSASVLSLELDYLKSIGDTSPKVAQYYDLLQATHDIWANNPTRFRESARGAELLKAILKKYSDSPKAQLAPDDMNIGSFETNTDTIINQPTPESLSDMQGTETLATIPSQPEAPYVDMFDAPYEVDWALWDSTFQGQSNMLPQQNWPSANTFMEPRIGAPDSGSTFDPFGYEFNGWINQLSAGDTHFTNSML